MFAVALNNEVLDPHSVQVISADHREHRSRFGPITDRAIGIQRMVHRQRGPVASNDAGDRHMKAGKPAAPNGHSTTDVESLWIGNGDLFLPKITIGGEHPLDSVRFAENGFPRRALNSDVRAQMQRIAHKVFSRTDLDRTAA